METRSEGAKTPSLFFSKAIYMSNPQPSAFVLEHAPWSYSKASVAAQCPLRFHLKYVKKHKGPAGTEAEVGKVVHAALAYALTGRPVQTCFTLALAESPTLTTNEIEKVNSFLPSAEKFIRRFTAYTKRYPSQTPVIEKRMSVNLEGKPVDFFDNKGFMRGVLDVYLMFTNAPDAMIMDHKTGKEREIASFAEQFDVYTLLLKAKEPKIQRIRVGLNFLNTDNIVFGEMQDVPDVQPLLERVITFLNKSTKNAEAVHVTNRGPLCAWCEFQETLCPAFEKKERIHGQESSPEQSDTTADS